MNAKTKLTLKMMATMGVDLEGRQRERARGK
jgi:hypothetical protein